MSEAGAMYPETKEGCIQYVALLSRMFSAMINSNYQLSRKLTRHLRNHGTPDSVEEYGTAVANLSVAVAGIPAGAAVEVAQYLAALARTVYSSLEVQCGHQLIMADDHSVRFVPVTVVTMLEAAPKAIAAIVQEATASATPARPRHPKGATKRKRQANTEDSDD